MKCAGEKSQLLCGFFLNFSLFGTGVVYTLTSATSMRYLLSCKSVISYYHLRKGFYFAPQKVRKKQSVCMCS
jgi:hypothetical protein